MSGDLRAACRTILAEELDLEGEAKTEWSAEDFAGYLDRSEQLRELCAFAVSEEYFQARQALGVTARSPPEARPKPAPGLARPGMTTLGSSRDSNPGLMVEES